MMKATPLPVAPGWVFLQPGELHFGEAPLQLRTVLGSCVAITLWHPSRRCGGMCHYMLPRRGENIVGPLDGRYGDEAMQLLIQHMRRARTLPSEYQLKLFGGGNMFTASRPPNTAPRVRQDVGARNIEIGRELARTNGMLVVAEHLGGSGHRSIAFDLGSGAVSVKHHGLNDLPGTLAKSEVT